MATVSVTVKNLDHIESVECVIVKSNW